MKFAVNAECFILKLTGWFNVVSVSDFLSGSIYSVLNCCIVLRHLVEIEALCICCGGLWISGAVTELVCDAAAVSGSSHTDESRNKSALLPFQSGDAPHTHIQWNLGVRELTACAHNKSSITVPLTNFTSSHKPSIIPDTERARGL